MDYAELLNPSQLEAVEHIDGASVIVAGAGSGKTRVLTYKIAYMIEQGIPADSIMALTFTNKAAKEMRDRITKVVGVGLSRPIWMGTFHSIFSRILRIEAAAIGYSPQYTIYDAADSKSLVKSVIKELGLDEKVYKAGAVQNRISGAKNCLITAEEYRANRELRKEDSRHNMESICQIYVRYQQKLEQSNAMDFDDLLMRTAVMFVQHPEILEKYQNRFQYILVDEYQDTNAVQHQIVMMLARKYGNVCVVGDDAQSIYSFRGAEIENILSFRNHFDNCHVFKLEQNYRSTQTIVNAANSLIAHNRRQIKKNVFSRLAEGGKIRVVENVDDWGEARSVADEVEKIIAGHYASYQDMAVLYRTNAQSRVLEDCFRQKMIPYKIYGGLSFYQRKEIKDIIAYLRLSVNHEDMEAFKRVVNVPTRGIGATTVGKILSVKERNITTDIFEIMRSPSDFGAEMNKGTQKKVADFAEMIKRFSDYAASDDAYTLVEKVMLESGLMDDAARDLSVEGISRKENLDEFISSVHEFCDKKVNEGETDISLESFLSEVALVTDMDDSAKEAMDSVSLMTMHAAKGLEFEYVFIVGVEENLLPSMMSQMPDEIEEERRLLYVAITRAKVGCMMSYAQSRFINGQSMYSKPSRFIEDIDEKYLQLPRQLVVRRGGVAKSGTVKAAPVVRVSAIGDIREGVRVVHSKFGEGTVLSLYGDGDNARAKIQFDSCGEKTLVLKFARLVVI